MTRPASLSPPSSVPALPGLVQIHLAFQDAVLQGVTVCIASGDAGTDSNVGDTKAHVQYPGSDPLVLAVGGTTVGNVSGKSFDEWVWNDTFFGGQVGATGGGVRDFFTSTSTYANEFSYQSGANVPTSLNDGHVGRGVPDVAANASPNSGYPMSAGGSAFVGNGTQRQRAHARCFRMTSGSIAQWLRTHLARSKDSRRA
jgi:kumamolisin